jgi:PAS domain S-box-containing protein
MPTETILAWVKDLRGISLGRRGPKFRLEALQTLLENLPIAVSITAGLEHRFVYANRLYRHVLMPHFGEPVGRTVAEVFGDIYTPELAARRDLTLAIGEAVSSRDVPIRLAPDSGEIYWDVTQLPILADDGTAEGVLTLGIEVTEKVLARREAERHAAEATARARDLEHQHHRLELAAEATELGIWEWDLESSVLHWSDRQKTLWGLPQDLPATYEDCESRLHSDDRKAVLDAVQAVQDQGSDGRLVLEHRIVRADGAVRWISARARMFYDAEFGRPVRLIGTALDVTDRKEADGSLQRALAAKETLLREVNHRVKNSLALVSSMLSLQSHSISDGHLRQQVEDAHARIHTVALVHERLDSSGDTDSVQLDAYLEALCRDLENSGIGGSVHIEIAADPVRVSNHRAVPVALVLNELVTNALKYAYGGQRGTIWVGLSRVAQSEMCLTVRDSGAGLPTDFEARRGASLGFRIIEGLAQQLQGRFEFRRLARGAEFALTFSVESAAHWDAQRTASSQALA